MYVTTLCIASFSPWEVDTYCRSTSRYFPYHVSSGGNARSICWLMRDESSLVLFNGSWSLAWRIAVCLSSVTCEYWVNCSMNRDSVAAEMTTWKSFLIRAMFWCWCPTLAALPSILVAVSTHPIQDPKAQVDWWCQIYSNYANCMVSGVKLFAWMLWSTNKCLRSVLSSLSAWRWQSSRTYNWNFSELMHRVSPSALRLGICSALNVYYLDGNDWGRISRHHPCAFKT